MLHGHGGAHAHLELPVSPHPVAPVRAGNSSGMCQLRGWSPRALPRRAGSTLQSHGGCQLCSQPMSPCRAGQRAVSVLPRCPRLGGTCWDGRLVSTSAQGLCPSALRDRSCAAELVWHHCRTLGSQPGATGNACGVPEAARRNPSPVLVGWSEVLSAGEGGELRAFARACVVLP